MMNPPLLDCCYCRKKRSDIPWKNVLPIWKNRKAKQGHAVPDRIISIKTNGKREKNVFLTWQTDKKTSKQWSCVFRRGQ
ncbi:MAG: hypothetical protein MSS94_06560 [Clostridiales bacterium]|nr:hypothetical protein [Clostridiales bacterium]